MDFSESMFLFDAAVENFRSFIPCKDFKIQIQFTDVFTMSMNVSANDLDVNLLKRHRKYKIINKTKVRDETATKKYNPESNILIGQSMLFPSEIYTLMNNIIKYPLKLMLYKKVEPQTRMGSTHILWNETFIHYLKNLYINQNSNPAYLIASYNVFDEVTSKRIAVIKLNIQLSHFNSRLATRCKCLSLKQPYKFMYTGMNIKQVHFLSNMKKQEETTNGKKIKMSLPSERKSKVRKTFKNTNSLREIVPIDYAISEMNWQIDLKSITNKVMDDTSPKPIEIADIVKCKSEDSIINPPIRALKYIFGDDEALKNKVYYVGYFTVEKEMSNVPHSTPSTNYNINLHSNPNVNVIENFAVLVEQDNQYLGAPPVSTVRNPQEIFNSKSNQDSTKYRFKLCDSQCQMNISGSYQSSCSLDLPVEAADLITIKKCKQVDCNERVINKTRPVADDRILLDLKNLDDNCCVTETIEEVLGGVEANMKFSGDPCFCSCECQFGFSSKKTTYCSVCKGYEIAGNEITCRPKYDMTFPCPVFHKLLEKGKLKNWSTSGSDSRKKEGDLSQKSSKSKTASEKKASDKQNIESEKDSKKGKKSDKRDARFKFNYGYTAPKIGHCNCASPCTGTLGSVPKNMGWLWTAENVPGIKFRPMWKPGATNKHVVRLLKIAKNPGEVITKKRKKIAIKKKSLKRPLLIVHKKDGEYTITMETMKMYPKPRAVNQTPYEDKPVLTYTIGRTEAENLDRQERKERLKRRTERLQREFIQSTFRDLCHEICLKTYQQALGILPDSEELPCPCLPAHPGPDIIHKDASCSCSEEDLSVSTDTDSDEWIVEFTPPVALYDPKCKIKKVTTQDNLSQYTYLDYRVKLLDRYGNPVPRFFKGPCGKQQCSDLGGFWSSDHKWLEINIDGYIAPDGKWAPNNFTGPNGETVDAETGKFQLNNGKWLVVGVDGYVDCQNKWRYYSKLKKEYNETSSKKYGTGDIKRQEKGTYQSEATWSCFGDVSPKLLSKIGIIGHGADKKRLRATLKNMIARGEDVKIPVPSLVPRLPPKTSKKTRTGGYSPQVYKSRSYFSDREKCKHSIPSYKGITAVNEHGNKTYFRLKDFKNKRPKERLHNIKSQGISLSSFHVPCFSSFINSDVMKQQLYEKLQARLPERNTATQT